jgi:hypothetical protein
LFVLYANHELKSSTLAELVGAICASIPADPSTHGLINLRAGAEWLTKHPGDPTWNDLIADREQFIGGLGGIAQRKPLSDIRGIRDIVRAGRARPKIISRLDGETGSVHLDWFLRFEPTWFWDRSFTGKLSTKQRTDLLGAFRATIRAIICFSLADYLSGAIAAQVRLHRCDYCKRFFISPTSKADTRFCSVACKNAFHREHPPSK